MLNKNLAILDSQYHGYWCPGYKRSLGIITHNIEPVKSKLLPPRALRILMKGQLGNNIKCKQCNTTDINAELLLLPHNSFEQLFTDYLIYCS